MTKEARRVLKREIVSSGGIESLVDTAAYVLLVLGILFSLLPLFSDTLLGYIACVAGVFAALVQWVLFRCIAEVIRLLKHQNGLTYSGKITTASVVKFYACDQCGRVLLSSSHCEGCKAKIVGDVS